MPDLSSKCQVVLKAEATPGTAIALSVGTAIESGAVMTLASDVSVSVDPVLTERSAQSSSFSNRGTVVGGTTAKIGFKANMRGRTSAFSSSVLPDIALPLRACGCSVTFSGGAGTEIVTVAPVDTVSTWYTVGVYNDGRLYRIAGALGTVKFTFDAGTPPVAEFEFTGAYVAPSDLAMIITGVALGAPAPPPFLAAGVSVIGSYATPFIKSLAFDVGNTIMMRQDPNATSGFLTAVITGRKCMGSIDPEVAVLATKNYFAEMVAGTTGAITTGNFPSTGTQYNKQNLTIAKAKYNKATRGDRDGLAVVPIDFEAQANSDAGQDEFSLVFT